MGSNGKSSKERSLIAYYFTFQLDIKLVQLAEDERQ